MPFPSRLPALIAAALIGAALPPSSASAADPAPVLAFSHFAGPLGGYGNVDGTGATARFHDPSGLAFDSTGNLFVTDPWNTSVRKVTPAGVVTTVMTAASPHEAGIVATRNCQYTGLAIDAQDNLFVTDRLNNLIFKRTPAGTISLYTGLTGSVLFQSTDGSLAQASFAGPTGMTFDPAGNLYVADTFNHIIRKITPQGSVTTFVGMPPEYGHPQGAGVSKRRAHNGAADGTGTSAQFYGPVALAADASGNLYVADRENNTVRKVTPGGVVTTLAGLARETGSADGTGSAARFRSPSSVTVDTAGNVYVTDSGNGTIRKITPGGVVTTLAGAAGSFATIDGSAGTARFVSPKSILFDRSGRLLVGDGASLYNPVDQAGTIRAVTLDGSTTTVAGLGGANGSTDGKGAAARFKNPADVAIDAAGNVFVSDELNHTIRKITPDGTTTTFAGIPGQAGSADGAVSAATFNRPTGLAFDNNGNLLVADHDNHVIRKIGTDGIVSTFAGKAGFPDYVDGPASHSGFHSPVSIAVDRDGNVYVGDGDYFHQGGDPSRQYGTIRKIAQSSVTTVAGSPIVVQYEQGRSIIDGVGAEARFTDPTGVTVDSKGNLFVADLYAARIRKVTADGTTISLTLKDSSGNGMNIRSPYGITCDKADNLYVSDLSFGVLYYINLSASTSRTEGIVTQIAGTDGHVGSADGVGAAVQFNQPSGLKVDSKGELYVADTENNAIRRGVLAGPPVITTQPQSATVSAGGSIQFSVAATGTPAPTYQWYFNDSIFQGATGSTLSFASARASDAGDYTVVATNALGTATSAKATLSVTSAPVTPPTPPSSGGGGGGAPSWWFLLSLGAVAVFRALRICIRRGD